MDSSSRSAPPTTPPVVVPEPRRALPASEAESRCRREWMVTCRLEEFVDFNTCQSNMAEVQLLVECCNSPYKKDQWHHCPHTRSLFDVLVADKIKNQVRSSRELCVSHLDSRKLLYYVATFQLFSLQDPHRTSLSPKSQTSLSRNEMNVPLRRTSPKAHMGNPTSF